MTEPFSLYHTVTCGQAFRWQKKGEWFACVVDSHMIRVREVLGGLEADTSMGDDSVRRYFRVEDNFQEILCALRRDRILSRATAMAPGLRLLRQSPWECLISYICSIASNIPKITATIESMCECFGERLDFEGERFFAFPSCESLSAQPMRVLKKCGLGFRARYVSAASRHIEREGMDLFALRTLPYGEARRELVTLAGVGEKVADCVCLFSLDKLEAFPIDRWIRRVMVQKYMRREVSDARIRMYAAKKFGAYAGYAQEYLYSYARALRFK